jgi:hypothetical protein
MSTASFGKRYCKTGGCAAARCPRVRLPARRRLPLGFGGSGPPPLP